MKLPSLEDLFSSQEERDDAKLKRIYEISLEEIDPFPDHPFKVRDDEDMMNLVESEKRMGCSHLLQSEKRRMEGMSSCQGTVDSEHASLQASERSDVK